MNTERMSEALKRVASIIESSDYAPKDAVRRDVAHLRHALAGNRSSYRYLIARFLRAPQDHDLLKRVDVAFSAKGVYPPHMRKASEGVYRGDVGSGIELEIRVDGGEIGAVSVAGRQAKDLHEAADIFRFLKARRASGDLPPGAPPPDDDGDMTTFHCDNCGKDVEVDKAFEPCPSCGTEHTQCPGCDGWYDMNKNTADKCPLCGYSSWGDDDDAPEPINEIEFGEVVEVPASKPGLTYKLQRIEGTVPGVEVYSCSCPAWKIQKLRPEQRTCKHLKAYRGEEAEEHRVENT
jgi:hypothetical protein